MTTDDSIILKPKRVKVFALLCFAMAFCLGGILLIRHGIPHGWAVAIASGLGGIALLIILVTNHGCLTIDRQGFTLQSAFRSDTYHWWDVQKFGVGTIAGNRFVVFNCSPEFPRAKKARAAAAAMTGFECAISDIYGVPVEELADMLNEYQTCHAMRPETGSVPGTE